MPQGADSLRKQRGVLNTSGFPMHAVEEVAEMPSIIATHFLLIILSNL